MKKPTEQNQTNDDRPTVGAEMSGGEMSENDGAPPGSDPQHFRPAPHHHTHTVALVLLSLATLAVVIAAVIMGTGAPLPGGDEAPADTPPAGEEATPGSIVPVSYPETTDMEGTAGLPEALPVPPEAEIIQNYSSQLGAGRTQRIVVFDTERSLSELFTMYQRYLESHDFTIVNQEQSEDSAVLVSTRGEAEELIIVASTENGDDSSNKRRRVQINYVFPN